jgi:hypothetical protein
VLAIAAYQRELFTNKQNLNQLSFSSSLHAIRTRFGAKHWQADQQAKEALRNRQDVENLSAELVRTHHVLAAEQLSEARVVLAQARSAMAPQVERMAKLALEAEAKNSPASEVEEAKSFLYERVEALHRIHEELLYEMGLWAGVQPVRSPNALGDLYVHAHAPSVAVVPTLAVLYLGIWPYKLPLAPR